jgi:GNAT superfamily N-acetyltransferase
VEESEKYLEGTRNKIQGTRRKEQESMITLKRTNSDNKDFQFLVERLNEYLLQQYGNLQDFYSQFNKIDNIPNVVIAYWNNEPAGCGCFKKFDNRSVEVKRMFVKEDARGNGIGAAILSELEKWATELGNGSIVLEMGNRQPEAAILYKKQGYQVIPNYGQYIGMEETSICMKKELR